MRRRVYFEERQRFDQVWFVAFMILFTGGPLLIIYYGLYQQLILGILWGSNPVSHQHLVWLAIGMTLIIGLTNWFIFSMRLDTLVKTDGLYFRYWPVIRKYRHLKRDDIVEYEVKKYNPLKDYGGWGPGKTLGKGKAYNTKGNRGLMLVLNEGKKIMIGTQKPDLLGAAMNKLMKPTEEF